VRGQSALDVTGMDRLSVDEERVPDAADDPGEPVAVEPRGIPRVQPSVDEHSARLHWEAPIPGYHVRTADEQFACLIDAGVASVGSNDADIDEERRLAGRSHALERRSLVEQERERPSLRQPVALNERHPAFEERTDQPLGNGCAAGDDKPDGGEIGRRPRARREHRVEGVRVAEADDDAIPLDDVEDGLRRRIGRHHDRAADEDTAHRRRRLGGWSSSPSSPEAQAYTGQYFEHKLTPKHLSARELDSGLQERAWALGSELVAHAPSSLQPARW